MAEIHVRHNRGGKLADVGKAFVKLGNGAKKTARVFDEFVDAGSTIRGAVTDTPAAHATLSMWDLGKAAFWRGMSHRQMMEHTCPAFHEGWWIAHSTVRMIGGTHAHFNVD